eukprot:GEMP01057706.1.p1 GENE.GEMP01057706.1~~GEMP01057706.1.p1  ORF type:complete len:198 (+),score=43.15 GEMP01057706.1:28-594(+)
MFRSCTRRDLLQAYRALTAEGKVHRFDESQWRAIQTLNDLIPQVSAPREATWVNAKHFERPSVNDDSVGDQLRRMADENKRRLNQQLEGQHAVHARTEGIVEVSGGKAAASSPPKEKQQRMKKNVVSNVSRISCAIDGTLYAWMKCNCAMCRMSSCCRRRGNGVYAFVSPLCAYFSSRRADICRNWGL